MQLIAGEYEYIQEHPMPHELLEVVSSREAEGWELVMSTLASNGLTYALIFKKKIGSVNEPDSDINF